MSRRGLAPTAASRPESPVRRRPKDGRSFMPSVRRPFGTLLAESRSEARASRDYRSILSARVHYHVNAPRGKLSFHITCQEPLRLVVAFQYRIHVAERQSTHEQVRLFPRTELRDGPHFLWQSALPDAQSSARGSRHPGLPVPVLRPQSDPGPRRHSHDCSRGYTETSPSAGATCWH